MNKEDVTSSVNLINKRLELNTKLLDEVNSSEEYEYLINENNKLMQEKTQLMSMKGGKK